MSHSLFTLNLTPIINTPSKNILILVRDRFLIIQLQQNTMIIRNYLTLTYVSLRLALLSFPCSSAFSLSQPSITSIHFPSTTMQLKESRVNFHSFDAQYDRRKVLMTVIGFGSVILGNENVAFGAQFPEIDVNNALAREYTAFPGLYPTIATKIVNGAKKRYDS